MRWLTQNHPKLPPVQRIFIRKELENQGLTSKDVTRVETVMEKYPSTQYFLWCLYNNTTGLNGIGKKIQPVLLEIAKEKGYLPYMTPQEKS